MNIKFFLNKAKSPLQQLNSESIKQKHHYATDAGQPSNSNTNQLDNDEEPDAHATLQANKFKTQPGSPKENPEEVQEINPLSVKMFNHKRIKSYKFNGNGKNVEFSN